MNELEQILAGESAHAAPATILKGLPGDAAHRVVEGAPHTIYRAAAPRILAAGHAGLDSRHRNALPCTSFRRLPL